MFSNCLICKDFFFFTNEIEENATDSNITITWSKWINSYGRSEKKEFPGTVEEAIVLLKSKFEYFLFHVYIKRGQSTYFEELRTEVSDERILLQMDFAENFNMKEQNETQQAHWSTKSLSIFTAFVWSKS